MTRATAPHKALILFLALFFLMILAASLWQRFQRPDLVIRRMPEHAHAERGPAENMEAIARLMRQAAQNPNDLETSLRLTQSLMAAGEWQGAENFAKKALSLSANDPLEIRPLYFLSLIHHNMGRHEQAAELLEKILEKTDNPSARYNLGVLCAHYLSQPEKGMEHFQKALEHKDLSPGLKAALEEELGKIKAALPNARGEAEPPETAPVPPESR